ncbi:MAG: Crp/Fnr family transcriptional regulator [Chitinophagales bacterium]
MSDLKEYIHELFPQLAEDEELLKEFDSNIIRVKTFKKGEIIVDYGDQIKFVPLVLEGILKVLRENEEEKEVLLYFLSGGHTCAASFSCCMIKKRSEIKVIADTKSRVAFIPLDTTNEWMRKYDTWRNFVFSAYDDRLFSMIDTIDRLAFSKLDEQLLNYLDERSNLISNKEISLSHADIARDLSVSREAISRLLKKLEDQNKIKLGRNKITLVKL